MTFYGTTATAAGIVVPKKYSSRWATTASAKAPIGAGPVPVREQQARRGRVLEANPKYWRKVPNIKS